MIDWQFYPNLGSWTGKSKLEHESGSPLYYQISMSEFGDFLVSFSSEKLGSATSCHNNLKETKNYCEGLEESKYLL